jgi:hypothetical protein
MVAYINAHNAAIERHKKIVEALSRTRSTHVYSDGSVGVFESRTSAGVVRGTATTHAIDAVALRVLDDLAESSNGRTGYPIDSYIVIDWRVDGAVEAGLLVRERLGGYPGYRLTDDGKDYVARVRKLAGRVASGRRIADWANAITKAEG